MPRVNTKILKLNYESNTNQPEGKLLILNAVENGMRELGARMKWNAKYTFQFFSEQVGKKNKTYFYEVFRQRMNYNLTHEQTIIIVNVLRKYEMNKEADYIIEKIISAHK